MGHGVRHGWLSWAPTALVITLLMLHSFTVSSCGQPSVSAAGSAKLEAALRKIIKANSIPGAVAGTMAATGKSWAGAVGKADVQAGLAMQPSMKFRIGSNTKSFTSVIILQLCDEKKMSLDDPLSKYLPEYGRWSKVTLRQLLNMTSGIFNFTDDAAFWAAVQAEPLMEHKPAQLVAIAAAHEDVASPGRKWSYSNTNYILLGMIIEKVTGRSAGREITSRIIDRLGLKDTEFPTGSKMTGSYSHGYWSSPQTGKLTDVTWISPSIAWTAGGMTSTIADMSTFLDALVGGKLVSKAAYEAQMTFIETGMPFVKYGLGVMQVNKYVGNGGSIPGFNSAMFKKPPDGEKVVCMFNKDPSDSGVDVAMTSGVFGLMAAMAGM
jgi:D-alanyl-D-alanine carboxypeptidase